MNDDIKNIDIDEIEDADFEEIIEVDGESLKMPTVFNSQLENLYDINNIFDSVDDIKTELAKPNVAVNEEIDQLKLRADFLKEVSERNFSQFEKIKNNYYLDGELAIKVKKSLLGKVKSAEAGINPSPKVISAMLSEFKPVIYDIEVDNPDFMDNFKQGLIIAVDEDGFDIDTLKVARVCPNRKEMLKLIDEVKNRNSLKFGDKYDEDIEDETIKSKSTISDNDLDPNLDFDDSELTFLDIDNEMSDNDSELEMLALENFEESDLNLLPLNPDNSLESRVTPSLLSPSPDVYALPEPEPEPDFDKVFDAEDLNLDDEFGALENEDNAITHDNSDEMEALRNELAEESEPTQTKKRKAKKSNRLKLIR